MTWETFSTKFMHVTENMRWKYSLQFHTYPDAATFDGAEGF